MLLQEVCITVWLHQKKANHNSSLSNLKTFQLILAAGIVIEEKNWPPFFPLIHNDIANEIPIHLQNVQYVAFTTLLGEWT